MLDTDQHRIHEEYVCDDEYQEDEDLPFGMHLIFDDGPEYAIQEPYRALWHKDKAIEILDEEGYDALVEYF
jgi:hypothetical protein